MSEVIYMYRRKGQDSWATCDESRYLELGGSHLFEVRIIHTGNEYAALRATHPAPDAVRRYMESENLCFSCGESETCCRPPLRDAKRSLAATHPAPDAEAWKVSGGDARAKTYDQYPKWAEGDPALIITPLYAHPAPASVGGVEAELAKLEAGMPRLMQANYDLRQQRDAALAECERLSEALQQADDYLSHNKLNEIGSGSILHRAIQTALSAKP